MDEVSFGETSSVIDETDISMKVCIGGADKGPDEDMLTPDSLVAETSGSSKPVQLDLPSAEIPVHKITNTLGLQQSKRSPSFARDPTTSCS